MHRTKSLLLLRTYAPHRITTLRHQHQRRPMSTIPDKPPPSASPHAQFYSDMLPNMVPIALLGSALFLGLRLLQGTLSHERYLDEATAKVAALEREVEVLRAQRAASPSVLDPPPHGEPTSRRLWFW
ncbi:hypothetical protein BC835DRAFT_1266225 [Cytidiella melzeri]|nr:hypothetical protein BC835DRAFT_1266225 [Cytidiella melzeri]